jgi:hypothetical protein
MLSAILERSKGSLYCRGIGENAGEVRGRRWSGCCFVQSEDQGGRGFVLEETRHCRVRSLSGVHTATNSPVAQTALLSNPPCLVTHISLLAPALDEL